MKTRVADTIKRHDKGFNCAQSVACTYCDMAGVDERTMFKATEAFGLGMGGMNGTCGAVSGACAVLGAMNSTADLEKPSSKGETYKLSKELTQRFMDRNGTLVCRELKGAGSGKVIRSCPDCIRDAAEILEDILERGVGNGSGQR